MTSRLLEEASGREKQQSLQVGELERLVLDQHSMIESIQQRYSQTESQEELLMAAQEQLKVVSAENAKWQSKFQLLEDNSKYLANQIDELLPQLSLKNTKILQLENHIKEIEPKTPPVLVESGSQTHTGDPDAYPKLTFSSLYDGQVLEDQPKVPQSDQTVSINNIVNETPFVHSADERVEVSHDVVPPAPKAPPKGSRKSKSHPLQRSDLSRSVTNQLETTSSVHRPVKRASPSIKPSPSIDVSPPSGLTRTLFEVSQDSDLYNQSLEIYGSSLFDIVERMEELETTFRSTSLSERRR